MYQIIMTEHSPTGQVLEEYTLNQGYADPRDADHRCMKLAEEAKNRIIHPAILVQHHAGLSVAFFKSGNYTEFHRSAWRP